MTAPTQGGDDVSGAQAAKDAARDVAGAALQDAAKGAAVGGAAGAAVGAAKGAAKGFLRNKTTRRWVIGGAAFCLAVLLAVTVGVPVMLGTMLTQAVTGGQAQNATSAATASGLTPDAISAAYTASDRYGIPWEVIAAADRQAAGGMAPAPTPTPMHSAAPAATRVHSAAPAATRVHSAAPTATPVHSAAPTATPTADPTPATQTSGVDWAGVAAYLNEHDPQRRHRSLVDGAVYNSGQSAMTIPATGPGHETAQAVQTLYTGALTAAGMDPSAAAEVFTQAQTWALGQNQCGTPQDVADAPGGPTVTVAGLHLDTAQVANVRTVIGVAKTLFGTTGPTTQQAAIIGLATADVESTFQNYANSTLPYSLQIPHQAVGHDHDSIGIMQQRPTAGWGAEPGSTWATDPHGVITRLMTSAYAAAMFYQHLRLVPLWQTMPPGQAAQAVQGSARPDAYTTRIPAAQALWAQYGPSAPAVAVPGAAALTPPTDSGGGSSTALPAAASCGPSVAGGTVPSGTEQALAEQVVSMWHAGKIGFYKPYYDDTLDEILPYAHGDPIDPKCTLDPRILQIIIFAADTMGHVDVNSLNRRCTNDAIGAGTHSMHWFGKAVDFGDIGNTPTTGGDPASIKLIEALKTVLPPDGAFGQEGCDGRPASVTAPFTQFPDTCTHLHVQVGFKDTPLK